METILGSYREKMINIIASEIDNSKQLKKKTSKEDINQLSSELPQIPFATLENLPDNLLFLLFITNQSRFDTLINHLYNRQNSKLEIKKLFHNINGMSFIYPPLFDWLVNLDFFADSKTYEDFEKEFLEIANFSKNYFELPRQNITKTISNKNKDDLSALITSCTDHQLLDLSVASTLEGICNKHLPKFAQNVDKIKLLSKLRKVLETADTQFSNSQKNHKTKQDSEIEPVSENDISDEGM